MTTPLSGVLLIIVAIESDNSNTRHVETNGSAQSNSAPCIINLDVFSCKASFSSNIMTSGFTTNTVMVFPPTKLMKDWAALGSSRECCVRNGTVAISEDIKMPVVTYGKWVMPFPFKKYDSMGIIKSIQTAKNEIGFDSVLVR